MNYNTFVKLRGVGCLALIVAPIAFLGLRGQRPQPDLPRVNNPLSNPDGNPVPEAPPRRASEPTTGAEPGGSDGLSDVDREVLRLQKQPLSNGTQDTKGLKWRIKNGGVVIELRCDQDKGYTFWNRAKVDANNNKQFDETWAFKKDGTVERRVAPNDDQNYTQTFRLDGETWVPK